MISRTATPEKALFRSRDGLLLRSRSHSRTQAVTDRTRRCGGWCRPSQMSVRPGKRSSSWGRPRNRECYLGSERIQAPNAQRFFSTRCQGGSNCGTVTKRVTPDHYAAFDKPMPAYNSRPVARCRWRSPPFYRRPATCFYWSSQLLQCQ